MDVAQKLVLSYIGSLAAAAEPETVHIDFSPFITTAPQRPQEIATLRDCVTPERDFTPNSQRGSALGYKHQKL